MRTPPNTPILTESPCRLALAVACFCVLFAPRAGLAQDRVVRLPELWQSGPTLDQPPAPPGMIDGAGAPPENAEAESAAVSADAAKSDSQGGDATPPAGDEVLIDEKLIEQEPPPEPPSWWLLGPTWYEPVSLWEGSLEFGLDGTEGNSQTLNYRVGLDLTRESESWEIDLDLDYNRKTNQSETTTNRAFLDWRLERLFHESPWTWFVHGTVEHDEFDPYDLRVTTDTGLGYKLIRTEATKLTGRVGGGFAREFGLPDEEEYWVPEATFGMQFQHQFSKRHKVKLQVEYMPDVTAFSEYRINTEGSWEALIDEEMNLSLKLAILDRYDSTPSGGKRNDLDYSATLLWQF